MVQPAPTTVVPSRYDWGWMTVSRPTRTGAGPDGGMARPEPFPLFHELRPVRHDLAPRVGAVTDHDDRPGDAGGGEGIEHVDEQRLGGGRRGGTGEGGGHS